MDTNEETINAVSFKCDFNAYFTKTLPLYIEEKISDSFSNEDELKEFLNYSSEVLRLFSNMLIKINVNKNITKEEFEQYIGSTLTNIKNFDRFNINTYMYTAEVEINPFALDPSWLLSDHSKKIKEDVDILITQLKLL